MPDGDVQIPVGIDTDQAKKDVEEVRRDLESLSKRVKIGFEKGVTEGFQNARKSDVAGGVAQGVGTVVGNVKGDPTGSAMTAGLAALYAVKNSPIGQGFIGQTGYGQGGQVAGEMGAHYARAVGLNARSLDDYRSRLTARDQTIADLGPAASRLSDDAIKKTIDANFVIAKRETDGKNRVMDVYDQSYGGTQDLSAEGTVAATASTVVDILKAILFALGGRAAMGG